MSKGMEEGRLRIAGRHVARRMGAAIKNNPIRALTELIYNSNDSYIRLEEKKKSTSGSIVIEYNRVENKGCFVVRDLAEGMSPEEIRKKIQEYGNDTSGMSSGGGVRGYFGQGAKNALVVMKDGRICTFKNDIYTECALYVDAEGYPSYRMEKPVKATKALRSLHKISGNGTVAYFNVSKEILKNIPLPFKVRADISNYYFLRKILGNPKRKVFFVNKKKRTLLVPNTPVGKEIMKDAFVIPFEKFGNINVTMSLCRAEVPLTQEGDDKSGGLLILDECDAVHALSLFKYKTEPLASHFFGEVKIDRFKELLETGEQVVREERDGLDESHPFCKELISQIEARLEKQVKEERDKQKSGEVNFTDYEEKKRHVKGIRCLNNLAASIIKGKKDTENDEGILDPTDGFNFMPPCYQISENKRGNLPLYIDTQVVPIGSTIKIECSSKAIELITTEISITEENTADSDVIKKYISFDAKKLTGEEGCSVTASVGNLKSTASVKVAIEEEDKEKEKELRTRGLLFEPEDIDIRPNIPEKISLKIYTKVVPLGSIITLTSDNPKIKITPKQFKVKNINAERGVVSRSDIEVSGSGEGESAYITATWKKPQHEVLAHVVVRSKKTAPTCSNGMFTQIEYDCITVDPLYATTYSRETKRITIYEKWPFTEKILGVGGRYRKTLSAQMRKAQLIAGQALKEIAREHLYTLNPDPDSMEANMNRRANELAKEHEEKFYNWFVDSKLLLKDREKFADKN